MHAWIFAISLAKIGSNEFIFLCSLYLKTVFKSIDFLSSHDEKIIIIAINLKYKFCLKINMSCLINIISRKFTILLG